MSNPNLELVDIPKVVEIAHSYGALVVVDNVFTTPVFSNAIELGVDVVVYSATKHIDGQGRALGGVVLGKKDFIRNTVEPYMKHTGSSMSPFNAWIMLKGLETIELRVKAQAESAFKISQFLETSSEIKKVIYPGLQSNSQHELAKQITSGFGTVTTFEFIKGKKAAFKFLNNLDIIILSNNLGDAKSIATHPATTTHQRLSEKQKEDLLIGDGLVRLSVGLEDTDDLINDVSSALTTL
jgi:O-succinylhomoserine sulfhydrylase